MTRHRCLGDRLDPAHECQCDRGRDHSSEAHRFDIARARVRNSPISSTEEADSA